SGVIPPFGPHPSSSTRAGGGGSCESTNAVKSTTVSLAQARRIAVRGQLLDGSATTILDTVQTIGFLQIDPIASVATPQHLVLWSRLGPFDTGELDRLLWQDKKLFEYGAFIRPIEDYPLVLARVRRKRTGKYAWERRGTEFLQKNAGFRRHVLGELERRGPLLSRELVDTSVRTWQHGGWRGSVTATVRPERS